MCFSHGKKSDAFSTGAVLRFGCGGARVTRETFLLVSFKFLLSLLRRAFEWLLVFIFFFWSFISFFTRLLARNNWLAFDTTGAISRSVSHPFRRSFGTLSEQLHRRLWSILFQLFHHNTATFQHFQAYSRAISVQFQFSFKAKWSNYPLLNVGDSSVVSVQFLTNYKTNWS